MKKILIVEDMPYKRDPLIQFLNKENIRFEVCEYLNDALRYIYRNSKDISGIILDLGLERDKKDTEYDQYMGVELIEETQRIESKIPILINSTTEFELDSSEYPDVFGHRTDLYDYKPLENFISFLREKEKKQ